MGGIRRIKRQLGKQQIAMSDAGVVINGCRIFVGHPNPSVAAPVAKQFGSFMKHLTERASCTNVQDIFKAHFKVMEELKESVANENTD